MQGHTKANESTTFPAFYQAAAYAPAATGSNLSRWFLPSIGEWALFFKGLKYTVTPVGTNLIRIQNGPTEAAVNLLFTQVGGTTFFTQVPLKPVPWYYAYHTSSERTILTPYFSNCWFVDTRNIGNYMILDQSVRNDDDDMRVRPFIHF